MNHVVVVGSGVIGLCLAWELQKRGHDVTLVDENIEVSGASTVNAGWIVPAMSAPVPAPGVIGQSLKWLVKPDAPFSLSVRPNIEFVRWATSFMRACSSERFASGFAVMSHLSAETLVHFDRLIADGIAMEHQTNGLLYSFTSEASLQHELTLFDRFHPAGYKNIVPLRDHALRDIEPDLTDRNVSGFLLENERAVRPESLLAGLIEALRKTSVQFRTGRRVIGLVRSRKQIVGIQLGDTKIQADAVVVASGVGIRPLLRTVGIRVPIEPGKGYSLTWETDQIRLLRPVYLHDDRIAITPFDGAVRAAGMMHLGQSTATLSRNKIMAIGLAARKSFRHWPAKDVGMTASSGLRAITPDGLPIIGKVAELDNLFLAGGHAMLGVTLAPVTAFELANLLESGHPSDRIVPLALDRFS